MKRAMLQCKSSLASILGKSTLEDASFKWQLLPLVLHNLNLMATLMSDCDELPDFASSDVLCHAVIVWTQVMRRERGMQMQIHVTYVMPVLLLRLQ